VITILALCEKEKKEKGLIFQILEISPSKAIIRPVRLSRSAH